MIGGGDGALVTRLPLRVGRCWAGGVQYGATPLFMACQEGHEEVVKLLLADERVDVNQAMQVRVGGEGERGRRERAARAGGCGVCVCVCVCVLRRMAA